jgi:mycoredoxin
MFTMQPTHTRRSSGQSTAPVVVYGTSWCAHSQKVRRYLDRLGIPFEFRDMDYDPEATRRVQWWTGGYASHPTVQIGGQVLVEPSLNELDWALSQNGLL